VRNVVAIEFLAGAQALDFQTLAPGKGVAAAHARLRENVPHLARDRYLARDIETARDLLRDGPLLRAAEKATGALEAF
jgi:histidine ammonia-lyase